MVASRLERTIRNRERNMVEIIRADLHNPRHGEALIAMLDEYARGRDGGGSALADEVKANLADALAARPVPMCCWPGSMGSPLALPPASRVLDLRLSAAAQYPRHWRCTRCPSRRGIGKQLLAEAGSSPGSSVAAS